MAYTNSGLVNYKQINPVCKNSPRNHVIDTVTIHCYVAQASCESMAAWLGSAGARASANYGVAYDGRIYLCVDECDRSWCTSSGDNDHRAVTIEVASDQYHPYAVTEAAYSSLITLLADICYRNNIRQLKWSFDKNERMNHLNGVNMTAHRDYAAKACPGDYLYNREPDIAQKVNAILSDPNYKPVPGTPATPSGTGVGTDGTYGGGMMYVQIPINMEMINDNMDYYIVTMDRFSKIPDIEKLMANRKRVLEDNQKVIEAKLKWEAEHPPTEVEEKEDTEDKDKDEEKNKENQEKDEKEKLEEMEEQDTERFDDHTMLAELREQRKADKDAGKLTDYDTLGFIVEAGYLFDKDHNRMNSYFNPQLKEMMAEIEKNDAPFGFFAVTRAKNEQEARDELEQLRLVFGNYRTQLGFWLVMDLPYKNPTEEMIANNDKILATYRHYLVDYYGFVQKMGLYATADQLKAISWADIQQDWFLWLVDHVDDLDEFLHPQTTVTFGSGGAMGGGSITSGILVDGIFKIPDKTTNLPADQWKSVCSQTYMCLSVAKYLNAVGYQRNAIIGILGYALGECRAAGLGFHLWQSFWMVPDPNGHTFPTGGSDVKDIPISYQCFDNQKWLAWLNRTNAYKVDPSGGSISVGMMSQTDYSWTSETTPSQHLAHDFVNDGISKGEAWQSPNLACWWVQHMTEPTGQYSYLANFIGNPHSTQRSAVEWNRIYAGVYRYGQATPSDSYVSYVTQAEGFVNRALGS